MDKGEKNNNFRGKSLIFLAVIASIGFLFGCATTETVRTEEAGWYGITQGWNYDNSDIDGEVGHPLFVSTPQGKCLPSRSWTVIPVIDSGTLPPGLTMNNIGQISGIPTERGHWVVQVRLSNIECEGGIYKDYTQQLRFHITGTGKVIQ